MQFLLFNNVNYNPANIPDNKFNHKFTLTRDTVLLINSTLSPIIINTDKKYIILGDIILKGNKTDKTSELEKLFTNFDARKLKDIDGIFYLFEYSADGLLVNIYNSLFSILPIFYYAWSKTLLVSSSIGLIKTFSRNEFTVNKTFLLQQILFNYSLFNSTIYKQIKLLKSNSYLCLKNNGFNESQHFFISDYYTSYTTPWRKSIDDLSDLFIYESQKYFSSAKSYISYTSGFDGRTLTAIANGTNKDYTTFSFGTHSSDDIKIPLIDNNKLGLNYIPVYLDCDEYLSNEFLKAGAKLIELTSGNSNFLYGHFIYANQFISNERNIFLNGFCGSELLRSMHIAGALTSRELIAIFAESEINWTKQLVNSPKLNYINEDLFRSELDETIEEIKTFNAGIDKSLTPNQRFYVYIFEEVFRKIFGYIISAQFQDNTIRSPFLNFNFISALLKTELAGVNNEFFTHNPLLRFKGQALYTAIIYKTYPALLKQTTGKGYKPLDLIKFYRRPLIFIPYIKKKILNTIKRQNLDNLGILSGIQNNKAYLMQFIKESNYYNNHDLNKSLNSLAALSEENRDSLVKCVSTAYYMKALFEQK